MGGAKKCFRSLRSRNCPPTFKTVAPPLYVTLQPVSLGGLSWGPQLSQGGGLALRTASGGSCFRPDWSTDSKSLWQEVDSLDAVECLSAYHRLLIYTENHMELFLTRKLCGLITHTLLLRAESCVPRRMQQTIERSATLHLLIRPVNVYLPGQLVHKTRHN